LWEKPDYQKYLNDKNRYNGSAMDATFYSAVTIGFLGSVHCIGMCGGIVSALNAGLTESHRQSRSLLLAYNVTYNAGRILSYCAAGAIAGLVGAQSTKLALDVVLPAGELIAGLVLIALGLYLAGWNRAIAWLETLGAYLWKYIQPLGKGFMPVKSPIHAFGLGIVWGWLPCGLVYSALALAMLSASPLQGAFVMLGFGLGTLPMLLFMGRAYDFLRGLVRNPAVRRLAGAVVILLGLYTMVSGAPGVPGHGHQQAPAGHSHPDNGVIPSPSSAHLRERQN